MCVCVCGGRSDRRSVGVRGTATTVGGFRRVDGRRTVVSRGRLAGRCRSGERPRLLRGAVKCAGSSVVTGTGWEVVDSDEGGSGESRGECAERRATERFSAAACRHSVANLCARVCLCVCVWPGVYCVSLCVCVCTRPTAAAAALSRDRARQVPNGVGRRAKKPPRVSHRQRRRGSLRPRAWMVVKH